MSTKNNTRKHSITILMLIAVVLVLLLDSSVGTGDTITMSEGSFFSDAGQYLLPEAKLFLHMVGRLFDLITNNMPST